HGSLHLLEQEITMATAAVGEIKGYANRLEGIASKQNILSLNASIEAARSGLTGAGFAVVASQMGDLAKDSAGIYDSIKKNAKDAYDSMEKMNQALER
ncbi:MAG: methyl-accepting chemotaxis protein, partial [Acetivibrio sp.]